MTITTAIWPLSIKSLHVYSIGKPLSVSKLPRISSITQLMNSLSNLQVSHSLSPYSPCFASSSFVLVLTGWHCQFLCDRREWRLTRSDNSWDSYQVNGVAFGFEDCADVYDLRRSSADSVHVFSLPFGMARLISLCGAQMPHTCPRQ